VSKPRICAWRRGGVAGECTDDERHGASVVGEKWCWKSIIDALSALDMPNKAECAALSTTLCNNSALAAMRVMWHAHTTNATYTYTQTHTIANIHTHTNANTHTHTVGEHSDNMYPTSHLPMAVTHHGPRAGFGQGMHEYVRMHMGIVAVSRMLCDMCTRAAMQQRNWHRSGRQHRGALWHTMSLISTLLQQSRKHGVVLV